MNKPIKALLLLSVGALLASCSIFSNDSSSSAQQSSPAASSSQAESVQSSEQSPVQSSERSSEQSAAQSSQSQAQSSEQSSAQHSESSSSESIPAAPVYAMKVGNAVVELHRNEGAVGEEYTAHLDLSEGDALAFVKDGAPIEVRIDPDENNNVALLEGSIVVRQSKQGADVYLKVSDDGHYEVWVSGYEAPVVVDVFQVILDNGEAIALERADDGELVQYKATLNVTSGQAMRFLLNGELITVRPDAYETNNLVADSSGTLRVRTSAENVDLYLKVLDDGYEAWLNGYEPPVTDVYTVRVGEGTPVTLSRMEDGQLTAVISVKKGDVVAFYKDAVLLDASAETYEGNNLLNGEAGMYVHNDAEEVGVYLKAKENDKYEVWLGGFVADPEPVNVYAMVVGEEAKEMAKTAGDLPEGTKEQYKITLDLAAGQELVFTLNGEPITVVPSPSSETDKNNAIIDEALKVVAHNAAKDADIYLKVMTDGHYEIWVGGYVEPEPEPDVMTMKVGDGEPVTMVVNEEAQYLEYMAEATVQKGDELIVLLNGEALSFDVDADENNNIARGEEGKVFFRSAGKSTVYVKQSGLTWSVWASGYEAPEPQVDAYTILVGGEDVAMESIDPIEGILAQYVYSADLEKDQALNFKLNGEAIEVAPTASAEQNINNAYVDKENVVRVHNAVEGGHVYLKLLANGKYEVWVDGYVADPIPENVYSVLVGEASLNMIDASEGMPEGCIAQFKATSDLVKGEEISFKLNGAAIPVRIDSDPNNNVTISEEKIVVRSDAKDADIYLKSTDRGYVVWVSGYQAEEPQAAVFSVVINENDPVALALNEGAEYVEYFAKISVKEGDQISFLKDGQAIEVAVDSVGANNVTLKQGKLVVVKDAADVNIYLKDLGEKGYEVWLEGNSEQPQEAVYEGYLGETKLNLAKSEEAPENTKEQYEAEADVKKGDVLTFKLNGNALEVKADTYPGNNVKEVEGALVIVNDAEKAGIYLKLLNDGTYQLWVGGYQGEEPQAVAYSVQIGSAEPLALTLNEQAQGTEYAAEVTVKAGDAIKFIKDGQPIEVAPDPAEGNNVALNKLGDLIVINDAAEVGIYLKDLGKEGYQVWLGGYKAPEAPDVQYDAYIGETKLSLTKSEEESENYKEQYEGKADLKKGDVLTFKKDGEALEVAVDSYQGNNATVSEGKIVVINDAEDAGIYLKLLKDGTYQLWVGGYKAEEPEEPQAVAYSVQIGAAEPLALALNKEAEGTEYMAEVTVKAGDAIKFIKDGQPIVVAADEHDGNNVKLNQSGDLIVINDAEKVGIYLKDLGEQGYEVWLGGYKAPEAPASVYGIKIGEGDAIELKKTDDAEKTEYKATITVKKGDVLSFVKDGKALEVAADPYETNNVKEVEGALVVQNDAANVDVYLKDLGEHGFQVWLESEKAQEPEEPQASTFAIKIGEGEAIKLTKTDDAEKTEYKATITVKKGDVISFLKDGKALEVAADPFETNNVKEVEGALVVQNDAANVDVYLKDLGEHGFQVWLESEKAQEPEEPEQAETYTLYFRDASWWHADAAATCVKIDDAEIVKMTHVQWDEANNYNLWKVEVPSDAEKITFLRYNGEGTQYWNAKTSEIDLTGRETHNLYDISETEAAWEDQGKLVAGAWGDYQVQIQEGSFLVNPISYVLHI